MWTHMIWSEANFALVAPEPVPIFWPAAPCIARKGKAWWAHKGSNLGPLPCEGNALPLSYAPGNLRALSKAWKGGQGKEHGSNQSPRFTKPTPPVSRQIPGGKPLKCCSGPLLSGSGGVRLQRPDALG